MLCVEARIFFGFVFDVVCHLSTGAKKMYVAFGNIRRPLGLLPLTMSVLTSPADANKIEKGFD